MGKLFSGADAAMRDLGKIIVNAPNEFAKALYQETELEAKECKRVVPVKTGTLKGTIHVTGPFKAGKRIWTFVVAGGPAADYAKVVHEDLEALHSNGEAKYIERPLNASRPYMKARVAKRIDLNRAMR